jgi:hypothetical protein
VFIVVAIIPDVDLSICPLITSGLTSKGTADVVEAAPFFSELFHVHISLPVKSVISHV